jgi:VanZ family protein
VAGSPSRASLWLPVLIYIAVIFGLSSIAETPDLPKLLPIDVSDKDLHAILYFGLGLLLTRALSGGFGRVTLPAALAATLCAMLYGVSDEFHQSYVPPRNVEALDVVADTIGAGIAAFGLYAWGIIRPRDGL